MILNFYAKAGVLLVFLLCQSCKQSITNSIEQSGNEFDPDTALVTDCEKISESKVKSANEYLAKGDQKLQKGQFDSAVKYFSLAIEDSPDFYLAYTRRGVAHKKSGDFPKAINDYKKAQQVNLEYATIDGCLSDNLANAYQSLGNYDSAISYHNQALNLSPRNPFIISNRGVTRMRMGNYEGATEDFKKSLELKPNRNPSLLNIGQALSLAGKHEESIRYFDMAIKEYEIPNTYALRGLAFAKLDKMDKACADLRFALQKGESKLSDFVEKYCQ